MPDGTGARRERVAHCRFTDRISVVISPLVYERVRRGHRVSEEKTECLKRRLKDSHDITRSSLGYPSPVTMVLRRGISQRWRICFRRVFRCVKVGFVHHVSFRKKVGKVPHHSIPWDDDAGIISVAIIRLASTCDETPRASWRTRHGIC